MRKLVLLAAMLAAVGAVWVFGVPREASEEALRVPDSRENLGDAHAQVRLQGARGNAAVAPPAAGNAFVHGRVLGPAGPVAARVDAFWTQGAYESHGSRIATWSGMEANGPPAASVEATGAAGYRIEVPAPVTIHLRATLPDGSRGYAVAEIARPGVDVSVDLVAAAGPHALRVRVLDAGGAPWKGWILAEGRARGGDESPTFRPSPAAVDAEGRTLLAGFAAGTAVLTAVFANGLEIESEPLAVPSPEEVTWTLPALHDVRVRVIDDGEEAVRGADVRLWGSSVAGRTGWRAAGTAGHDGRFAIALPVDAGRAKATAVGHAEANAEVPAEAPEEIVLRCARLGRCRGRVVDAATGAPVAGVPVFAAVLQSWMWRNDAVREAGRSDERGEFRIADVPLGGAIVFAFGAGWVSEHLTEIDHDAYNPFLVDLGPGREGTTELRVVRAGRVRGRVLSAGGAGVAGAKVRASEVGHYDYSCLRSPPTYDFGFVPAPPEVVAEADGGFEFDTLLPGVAYGLTASDASKAAGYAQVTARSGAETRQDVRLEPPAPTRRVVVRVVEKESGLPIAGASVSRECYDDYLGGRESRVSDDAEKPGVTGADGTAQFGPVPDRTWGVRATAPGRVAGVTQVKVDENAERLPVAATIELEPGRSVRALVRLPGGRPAAQAHLTVMRGNGSMERYAGPATGPDGTELLEGLARVPLSFKANVTKDGTSYEGSAEVSGEDTEVTVDVAAKEEPPRVVVRVPVIGPDGTPVPRADACVVKRLSKTYLSTDDLPLRDGILEVTRDDDPEQEWWLEVRRATDAFGRSLDFGPASAGPFRSVAELEGLVLRMGPGSTIRGRVVDAAGAGVRGLLVTADPVHPQAPQGGWPRHASTWTQADGGFVLDGLADFTYVVGTTVSSRHLAADAVRVVPGPGEVVIRLAPAVAVVVTVLDPSGRPLPEARVRVGPDEDSLHYYRRRIHSRRGEGGATADAEGRASLVHLAPGVAHVLVVEPPYDATETLLPRTLTGWVPHDVTVRLEGKAAVTGRLVDRQGAPLPGAAVRLAAPGEGLLVQDISGHTDEEGRFRLVGDLPTGPATFVIQVGRLAPQRFPVPALRGEISLVADAGFTLVVVLTGLPEDAQVPHLQVTEHALDGKGGTIFGTRDATGRTVTYRGLLESSTYTLFAYCGDPALVGHRVGVRPGARVELPMVAEKTVTGRLLLPADMRFSTKYVSVRGTGFSGRGDVDDEGRFVVRGLPPGPCLVEGSAYVRNEMGWGEADEAKGEVETETGSVVDVVMTRTDPKAPRRR